jgi:hypothetical protein
MSSQATFERTPAEIEASINVTRASLDRKLERLESKLSPRARLNDLKSRVHPQDYLGLAAVAAIATGAAMAVRGLRRARREDEDIDMIGLGEAEVAAIVCECE